MSNESEMVKCPATGEKRYDEIYRDRVPEHCVKIVNFGRHVAGLHAVGKAAVERALREKEEIFANQTRLIRGLCDACNCGPAMIAFTFLELAKENDAKDTELASLRLRVEGMEKATANLRDAAQAHLDKSWVWYSGSNRNFSEGESTVIALRKALRAALPQNEERNK